MSKSLLVLDFDGVCSDYASGWQSIDVCPDPPTDGLWRFLEAAHPHFTLAVHSSRSGALLGRRAMQRWCMEWGKMAGYVMTAGCLDTVDAVFAESPDGTERWTLAFPEHKPPAFLTIDDRAITFRGNWHDMDVEALRAFQPWTRNSAPPHERPRGKG